MLLRSSDATWIAVTQPHHASISGQLARAWGNDAFQKPEPFEDVCLGAEVHDIGWLDWEDAPTLNSTTGLPHTFMQLPTMVHLGVWGPASRKALTFGRYAALLASMHGTALYAFHDYDRDSDDEANAARAFVAYEHAFQHRITESLRLDPRYRHYVTDDYLRRNQRLVATWDAMSLAICGGVSSERVFRNVPAGNEFVEVTFTSADGVIAVSPWPFSTSALDVTIEGRVIDRTFDNEDEMRKYLTDARWLTFETHLRPA